jgi:putative FmdB family regulatory protein
MPTYEFLCASEECKHEWEDFLSMSAPIPACPVCGKEGKRLISGMSGRGIVNLTGNDLVNKVKQDAKNLENHAANNENYAANFVGDIYQKKQQQIDTAKRDGVFRRRG